MVRCEINCVACGVRIRFWPIPTAPPVILGGDMGRRIGIEDSEGRVIGNAVVIDGQDRRAFDVYPLVVLADGGLDYG